MEVFFSLQKYKIFPAEKLAEDKAVIQLRIFCRNKFDSFRSGDPIVVETFLDTLESVLF